MEKIIVFASGTKDGGGSGFQELVENTFTRILDAVIVAVVSNWPHGGVWRRAGSLGVPFEYMPSPWDAEHYQALVDKYHADWATLSGWLKLVKGLDPKRTFNIHPGPLPQFGGDNMYGHHVHQAVIKAFRRGKIDYSAVTMHFIMKEQSGEYKYDRGPIFFQYPITIRKDDNPETLGKRVNDFEHAWQPFVTNLVVHQEIGWDGENPESLIVPKWYNFHREIIF